VYHAFDISKSCIRQSRRFETAIKLYQGGRHEVLVRFCCTNWRLTAPKGRRYLTNSSLRNLAFMHVYAAYSSPGLQPPSTNSRISVAYTCEHGSLPTLGRLAFPPTLLSFLEFNCQLPKFDRKNLYQSERRILRYRILSKFIRIYFDNLINLKNR